MTHEDIHADLSLFALDALDPEERQAIQAHLASGCAACQHELASWREVVGSMALAGADAQPPDLKPTLMHRLHPQGHAANVIPLRRAPVGTRWLRIGAPLAAAAVALVALGIVHDAAMHRELQQQHQLVTNLRTALDTAHGNLEQLTQQLAGKERDLGTLRSALAAAQESLSIVAAPGLRLVHLKQTPTAQPAEAHALISTDTRQALFYAFDLPAAPEGKAYELWWITEKEGPVNAGVFQPDARGLGRVETTVPTGAGAVQAAAVTVESIGGVPKPTGPMILLGELKGS